MNATTTTAGSAPGQSSARGFAHDRLPFPLRRPASALRSRIRDYALAALSLLHVFTLVLPAGAAGDAPPLDRPVSLNLRGVGLTDAIREITAATGVHIRFYRPDFPPGEEEGNLHLVAGRAPLRTVLEVLARRCGFRYRLSAEGRVELSRSYGWAADDPVLAFTPLDGVPLGDGQPPPIPPVVEEIVKLRHLLPSEARLEIEPRPRREAVDSRQLVSALSPVLSDYLVRAISCLSGAPGDYPAPGRRAHPYAAAADVRPAWPDAFQIRVRLSGGDVGAALAELARQTNFSFVFAARPGEGAPRVEGGESSLVHATEKIAAALGLPKRVFLGGGAVSFEPGPGNAWEIDNRNRELFWDGLAVAGFDARPAAQRAGGGAALVELVRQSLFPGLWRDPACSVVYEESSGRLVLVAPLNVVEEVARFLSAGINRTK